MKEEFFNSCPDADHQMESVFDYAGEIGASLLIANFSRFTVDLNRNPTGDALYSDGRIITSVVPIQTFSGERIYQDSLEPKSDEKNRRITNYFLPYHEAIERKIADLRLTHSQVLLYDAHSIHRIVPMLAANPLPDLMLGTNGRMSAGSNLIETALSLLSCSKFSFAHNSPFSGGYITRKYGRPELGVHALQMERSQDIYFSGESKQLDTVKLKSMAEFEMSLLLKLMGNL
jgi:formiminoglutamase